MNEWMDEGGLNEFLTGGDKAQKAQTNNWLPDIFPLVPILIYLLPNIPAKRRRADNHNWTANISTTNGICHSVAT